eukprot:gnl/TRDRNA2_/TRDRNA2_191228_c0_seq1.p1 gnl/TRDRNA2_/TRDRNA2_191228_c0~~gnl/TRDRNA2_/TRDRNA2_191228_c0_seq1.p1  ORF type:complete len:469 (+),score=69.35 gnl/TRDRNA2_/TRDRNA2_191228_c0_seq1:61-1467(+)
MHWSTCGPCLALALAIVFAFIVSVNGDESLLSGVVPTFDAIGSDESAFLLQTRATLIRAPGTDAADLAELLDSNQQNQAVEDGAIAGESFNTVSRSPVQPMPGTLSEIAQDTEDSEDSTESGGKSCDKQYATAASIFEKYQKSDTSVLLFGWNGCPCTGIAQDRLADSKVCYKGRTWSDPSEKLMKYLQCRENDADSHSFVYFRDESGTWKYVGNGFKLQDSAMSSGDLDRLIDDSGAKTSCGATVSKNVYGARTEQCRKLEDDHEGSWDDDGSCTETTGGVHQICIEKLPADFSTATHQTAWSKERAGNRHCVCVGAWSLYMSDEAKHSKNAKAIMPHCSAIPATALTGRYLSHWKDWNGYPASIVKGLSELVSKCFHQVKSKKLQCGLLERVSHFIKEVSDDLQQESNLPKLKESICDEGVQAVSPTCGTDLCSQLEALTSAETSEKSSEVDGEHGEEEQEEETQE